MSKRYAYELPWYWRPETKNEFYIEYNGAATGMIKHAERVGIEYQITYGRESDNGYLEKIVYFKCRHCASWWYTVKDARQCCRSDNVKQS